MCKKIASDVRNTCYALTPSDLNEGIFEALISLCDHLKKQSGFKIIMCIQNEIREKPAFRDFSKDKNLNIYRIVQGILTNAIKHSAAESISVLVRTFDKNNFKIIVSDDGKGFDFKSALKKVMLRYEGFCTFLHDFLWGFCTFLLDFLRGFCII